MCVGLGGGVLGGGGGLFANKAAGGSLGLNLGQVGKWAQRIATVIGADTCTCSVSSFQRKGKRLC